MKNCLIEVLLQALGPKYDSEVGGWYWQESSNSLYIYHNKTIQNVNQT